MLHCWPDRRLRLEDISHRLLNLTFFNRLTGSAGLGPP